jgi:uncharacterized membrane protein (UPF0127 family)
MSVATFPYAFNSDVKTILASRLRVADTPWKRLIGLIGTPPERFRPGEGLWIVPSHGIHTFMMRFPIDVVYLTADHRVHHIEENVRPWRITPILTEAATVLELPSHTIFQTGTSIGDHIELHVPQSLKASA